MSINKIMTVDKFLGLHEPADGSTELKPGEAAVLENFTITDDYNLKLRPGITKKWSLDGCTVKYLRIVDIMRDRWLLFLFHQYDSSAGMSLQLRSLTKPNVAYSMDETRLRDDMPVKLFHIQDTLYVTGGYHGVADGNVRVLGIRDNGAGTLVIDEADVYEPLILTGCNPAGGGTELEPVNLVYKYVRVQFNGDGKTGDYKLPTYVRDVARIIVDGQEIELDGKMDTVNHTYRSQTVFPEGINNVEFHCYLDLPEQDEAIGKFLKMKHCEAYNGATDTRFFYYGDGTNVCYYSGVPTYGEGLYIPAGNEITVDASSSPITGMQRHYTKLMVFKPDGAFTIDYSPVTLADGRVIAGFYVRPASRGIGSDLDGQIQTVGNYPRTLCGGVLYEWRHNASYYQDERYAKAISQRVQHTLRRANPKGIVTCDDNRTQTYYMFLNDEPGTVLVHRYAIDVWAIYVGQHFSRVTCAAADPGGAVYFATLDGWYMLDESTAFDEDAAICARFESGYNFMGAEHLRKYTSYLWISMLPEANSRLEVTVQTDRRDDYISKIVGTPLMSWDSIDFSNFSFLRRRAPTMKRIKLKAKKYVYYKIVFTINHPGARATVLGYNQQVRYASEVK